MIIFGQKKVLLHFLRTVNAAGSTFTLITWCFCELNYPYDVFKMKEEEAAS